MIKLFYKNKLKSTEEEPILINLFSKWILLIYHNIRVCEVFFIYGASPPIHYNFSAMGDWPLLRGYFIVINRLQLIMLHLGIMQTHFPHLASMASYSLLVIGKIVPWRFFKLPNEYSSVVGFHQRDPVVSPMSVLMIGKYPPLVAY
jgi:hypothetical protein